MDTKNSIFTWKIQIKKYPLVGCGNHQKIHYEIEEYKINLKTICLSKNPEG